MPLNLSPLSSLKAGLLAATADAATETILAKSNVYIPKDTLTAENSGRVVVDADSNRVVITYGKDDDQNPKTGEPSNAYIEALHEDLEAKHAPGTGAKFLEKAADEMALALPQAVAGKVRLQ